MSATRLITLEDAPALAELQRANREFLAPYEPARPADYHTEDGQRAVVRAALTQHQQGAMLPHVILDEAGSVVGRVTLNEIVRGPFQSCRMGYWLSAAHNGRGLATTAVREVIRDVGATNVPEIVVINKADAADPLTLQRLMREGSYSLSAPRDARGYRIDHAFVSPVLLPRLRACRYSHEERLAGASDHSMLVVEFGAAG